MSDDIDIDDLAHRAFRGDRAAFEQLYRLQHNKVRGWFRKRAGNPHAQTAADDLAQETWLKCLRTKSPYDKEKGPFYAWFFLVAKRVLIDYLRGLGTEPGTLLDEGDISGSEPLDRPELKDLLAKLFRVVVNMLDETERQVFHLRVLEDLKHKEIAAKLGMTTAAVRAKWNRIRDKLLEAMDQKLDGPERLKRQIVELYLFDNLSVEKIADRLGIEKAAVDAVVDEIAKKAKDVLNDDESDPEPDRGQSDEGCDDEDETDRDETDGQ